MGHASFVMGTEAFVRILTVFNVKSWKKLYGGRIMHYIVIYVFTSNTSTLF